MTAEHIDHPVVSDRTTAFTDVHDIQALTATRPIALPGREGSRKSIKRTR